MRWIALLLALVVMLAIALSASTLAYWGLTAPAFADCTAVGRPFVHEARTYGRTSDVDSKEFSIGDGTPGISLRVQVKSRSALPLGIGGRNGSVSWVLTDPSGTARWQESTKLATYDVTRQFDRVPGQWRLQTTIREHSGGYAICLKPL